MAKAAKQGLVSHKHGAKSETTVTSYSTENELKKLESRWGNQGLIEVLTRKTNDPSFEIKACGQSDSTAEVVRISFEQGADGKTTRTEQVTTVLGRSVESTEIFEVFDSLEFLSLDY